MSTHHRNENQITLTDPGQFRRFGGWMDKPDDLQPQLQDDVSADVIVVGAGFAGLSTALELTARGAKVIVLEQEFAGFGASGRNAGYLAGSMGLEFELFVSRVGRERAKQIVRFYDAGVPYVEKRLIELGIDCDYNPSGLIRAVVHPSQEKRLRKSMEVGLDLGSVTRFVDQAEMRARGIPPAFLFGCTQRGGTLDPGKYVLGLRRAAIQAGVKLYEQTPLLSYSEGRTITCKTSHGSASAPIMVLATNAFTPQLGLLRNKVAPFRVSAIETRPLSATQLSSLGWRGREGIVTPHITMESHRLTARNTLVLTTRRPTCRTPAPIAHWGRRCTSASRPCAALASNLAGAVTSAWRTTLCRWWAQPGPSKTSSTRLGVRDTVLLPNRSWGCYSPSESVVSRIR
jgi:glycine/D-amino acid oxidase-like deaminating enzyme